MAEYETSSPEEAYASRNNIVVPNKRAGGPPTLTEAQNRAKTNHEDRIGKSGGNASQGHPPLAGKTLNSAPTLQQEP